MQVQCSSIATAPRVNVLSSGGPGGDAGVVEDLMTQVRVEARMRVGGASVLRRSHVQGRCVGLQDMAYACVRGYPKPHHGWLCLCCHTCQTRSPRVAQVAHLKDELEVTHAHYQKLLESVAGPSWRNDPGPIERAPGGPELGGGGGGALRLHVHFLEAAARKGGVCGALCGFRPLTDSFSIHHVQAWMHLRRCSQRLELRKARAGPLPGTAVAAEAVWEVSSPQEASTTIGGGLQARPAGLAAETPAARTAWRRVSWAARRPSPTAVSLW